MWKQHEGWALPLVSGILVAWSLIEPVVMLLNKDFYAHRALDAERAPLIGGGGGGDADDDGNVPAHPPPPPSLRASPPPTSLTTPPTSPAAAAT
jgi:hypothetical protein